MNDSNINESLNNSSSSINSRTILKNTTSYIYNDVEVDSKSVDLNEIVNKTPKLSLVNSGHLNLEPLDVENDNNNSEDNISDISTPPINNLEENNDKNNDINNNNQNNSFIQYELDSKNLLNNIDSSSDNENNNKLDNGNIHYSDNSDHSDTDSISYDDDIDQEHEHAEVESHQTSPTSTISTEEEIDNKAERNPFTLENKQSREIYTSKILDRQKSLENVPHYFSSNKPLINKRHSFIKKIVNRVFLTLKSATSDDLLTSQKNQILKELFRNISSELDDSVLEYLQCNDNKQPSPARPLQKNFASFSPLHLSADSIALPPLTLLNEYSDSPLPETKIPHSNTLDKSQYHSYPVLDDKSTPIIYYYQLIARYFFNVPSEVDRFRPLLHSLWNNHWFFLIFSSCFNEWILEYRLSLIPQVNVFIKATNRLFWHDMDHTTHRFKDIYLLLKKKLLDGTLWKGLNEATDPSDQTLLVRNRRIWIDFYHIITVFYFYYESDVNQKSLNEFTDRVNVEYKEYINNQKSEDGMDQLTVNDIFVRGIIRQLYLIKTEEVLINYIELSILFKDWKLNAVTKIKLQSCLYSFSKPGSPFHMPRDVRVASRKSLDILFPDGKISRYTVNLFFRLLHPYYSAGSIVHWIVETIKSYVPDWILKRLHILKT